jgi:hypothetical protein
MRVRHVKSFASHSRTCLVVTGERAPRSPCIRSTTCNAADAGWLMTRPTSHPDGSPYARQAATGWFPCLCAHRAKLWCQYVGNGSPALLVPEIDRYTLHIPSQQPHLQSKRQKRETHIDAKSSHYLTSKAPHHGWRTDIILSGLPSGLSS